MALRKKNKKAEEVQEEIVNNIEQEQNENKEQPEINTELDTNNVQNNSSDNQEQDENVKVEEPKQVQMQSLADFLF